METSGTCKVRLLKGTNHLLASKDHARAETKHHCVKFMASRHSSFAVGRFRVTSCCVPKTVDKIRHCKIDLRACNNLPQPRLYISVLWRLRKIVACSQIYLAVPSCIYSFWLPTSYILHFDTLVLASYMYYLRDVDVGMS